MLSNQEEIKTMTNRRKLGTINKFWLSFFLILLIPIGIYLSSEVLEIFPIFSNNQTDIPSQTALVTPSPLTLESPNVLLETDTFREAVNKAIKAANLTQSANASNEWETVVNEWQGAIALMRNVPSSSPNYPIAQQKIIEYQKNLDYAQKNSVSNK